MKRTIATLALIAVTATAAQADKLGDSMRATRAVVQVDWLRKNCETDVKVPSEDEKRGIMLRDGGATYYDFYVKKVEKQVGIIGKEGGCRVLISAYK